MAKFTDKVLSDGTKFIEHRSGGDLLIFEVKDGHILSISVDSHNIKHYRARLVKSGEDGSRSGVYGDTGMDAGGSNVRHAAVHELGVGFGPRHDHFGSRRDSVYDGIPMMARLLPLLDAKAVMEIVSMAKSTAT